MATRKVSFVEGEYYHIYNRGNSKQRIFLDREDYIIFIKMLFLFNQKKKIQIRDYKHKAFLQEKESTIVSISAYVLMPNHFHLLIKEITDRGISSFMRRVATGYVMYFNQKYNRTGSLFEGKFKARHLDSDRYLKYLFSYIHLNPLKLLDKDWKMKKKNKKFETFLQSYTYSSFLDYCSESREQKVILEKKQFPKYFASKKDFLRDLFSWLQTNDTEERPQ